MPEEIAYFALKLLVPAYFSKFAKTVKFSYTKFFSNLGGDFFEQKFNLRLFQIKTGLANDFKNL